MATKNTDYTKMVQEMMGAFPMDMSAMQDSFRNYASFGERMSRVALDAAERSAEIQHKWTRETLAKMAPVATVKDDAADYAKAMTDFASSAAEVSAENMSAFAEVAKKVQMETVELMLAAGREVQSDATEVMQKATAQASTAAKKTVKAA